MRAMSTNANGVSRVIVGVMLMLSLSGLAAFTVTKFASASTVVPTCAYSQLEIATSTDSGANAAAGNEGIPFIIVNHSKSTCSLSGYPRLHVAPSTYKNKNVKVIDGGGMIFVPVKPRLITIGPSATASFGVDYGDAYDQQDPNAGPCMSRYFDFSLPVRSRPFTQYFSTVEKLNFCYAGFQFSVTSIQSGPSPRRG